MTEMLHRLHRTEDDNKRGWVCSKR